MHEPEDGDHATYYQQLYRTYRNFLLNFLSVVLIFEIFYAGRAYSKYIPVSDKLKKLKDNNRTKWEFIYFVYSSDSLIPLLFKIIAEWEINS